LTPLDAAALAPLRVILDEMMQRHAPNPALLCDRHWTVLDATPSARVLLAGLQGDSSDTNVVRMLATSPLAAQGIANYPEVLQEMAGRIRLEALEAGADPVLAEHLRALEEVMRLHPASGAAQRRPLAPIILRSPTGDLSFLSTIAHFGTSEDVTVRDLRLELLFPVDDATRQAMAALG